MSDILAGILANTRKELAERMALRPPAEVRAAVKDAPPARSFEKALREKTPMAVIAEVKKASPSKGIIRDRFDPVTIARLYALAGAAGISVLTDEKHFCGKLEYLSAIRATVETPLLRKDFLIDEYQVWESRAAGADAVLLISDALEPDVLKRMLDLVHETGMEALVESHDLAHLEHAIASGARIIGVNNRNLSTFRVDIENTERLAKYVPADRVLVGESGIASADDVKRLASFGVRAVLVGETLMRADDVAAKLRELSLM